MDTQEPDITTIALNWALLQRQVVELISLLYSASVWAISHNESICASSFISSFRSQLTSTYEGLQTAQLLADRDDEWGCLLKIRGADLRTWAEGKRRPPKKETGADTP
jgi:hypothetical protein